MTRSAEDLTLLMRTLVPALDDTSTTKLPTGLLCRWFKFKG